MERKDKLLHINKPQEPILVGYANGNELATYFTTYDKSVFRQWAERLKVTSCRFRDDPRGLYYQIEEILDNTEPNKMTPLGLMFQNAVTLWRRGHPGENKPDWEFIWKEARAGHLPELPEDGKSPDEVLETQIKAEEELHNFFDRKKNPVRKSSTRPGVKRGPYKKAAGNGQASKLQKTSLEAQVEKAVNQGRAEAARRDEARREQMMLTPEATFPPDGYLPSPSARALVDQKLIKEAERLEVIKKPKPRYENTTMLMDPLKFDIAITIETRDPEIMAEIGEIYGQLQDLRKRTEREKRDDL